MMTRNELSEGLGAFLADLGEDAMRLGQNTIDLVTVLAVGALIYLALLNPADAGSHRRAMVSVDAKTEGTAGGVLTASHAPTSCGLTNDLLASPHRSCRLALELEPAGS